MTKKVKKLESEQGPTCSAVNAALQGSVYPKVKSYCIIFCCYLANFIQLWTN
jgi:hypothetical protein